MPVLEFDRQRRPLGPGVLTIGSAPEAGWRITEHDLAPIHALVTMERDGHPRLVRPAGSVRILVNDEEVFDASSPLAIGDRITLGNATLLLAEASKRTTGDAGGAYLRDLSRGRAYRVVDRLEIGRDPVCQVHLADPDVSRVHAELERDGDDVVLRARGVVFRNGTRVATSVKLEEGDEVSIGRTMLRFTRETPLSAAVVQPAAEGARRVSVDSRSARAATAFVGVVQMREHLARDRRRQWQRIATTVIVTAAVLLAGWSIATGGIDRAALARAARASSKSAHATPPAATARPTQR
jgi:predicted component of type VI protein secretion system